MRKKCGACLCRTCLEVCGKCMGCNGKTETCGRYRGFWQESIFGQEGK